MGGGKWGIEDRAGMGRLMGSGERGQRVDVWEELGDWRLGWWVGGGCVLGMGV